MKKVSFSLYVDPANVVHEGEFYGVASKVAGLIELPFGGMIVMSTDVNATSTGIKGLAKRLVKTVVNRVLRSRKIDDAVKEQIKEKGMDTGWSIGNLFKGRYYSRKSDQQFNEKSFAVDVRGVPWEFVLDVAKALKKKFDQESVLVINHETGRPYLLD